MVQTIIAIVVYFHQTYTQQFNNGDKPLNAKDYNEVFTFKMNEQLASTIEDQCMDKSLTANIQAHAPSVFKNLLKTEETIDIFTSFKLCKNKKNIIKAG
jgi:hypothetical protein